MAVVGEAHIIVRALTTGVERDIKRGFSKLDGVAGRTGKDMGNALTRGLTNGLSKNNAFGRLANQIKTLYPEADKLSKRFTHLMRIGYGVQGAMGALAGSIGTIIGGLGAFIGVAGGAAASSISLGSALASAFTGAKIAGMALKGVAQAASALRKGGTGGGAPDPAEQQKRIDDALKNLSRTIEDNQRRVVDANNKVRDSQIKLNQALKDGREEIQQIGFEAEDAALSESRAAIELEKARETLLRTQDLPPNSRARKEAEQAFKEADLNYRMAKDRASDLGKEQDRLARTGVEGTQVVKDARAELAAAEDDLKQTVVDAARAQADAELALAEALKKVETNAGGAANAMDGLTASQRRFAQYLASDILPKIDELREAVASKFLPALETALDKLFKGGFFEKLKEGFTLVADAAGVAVNNFVDAVVEPKNAMLLYSFLEQTAKLLPSFGTIFGNVWGSALRILDATSGMTERFVGWLESKTGAFTKFLDAKKATGELDTFFANVERVAGRFGGIFGNIFAGLGDIIMANIGPGTGGDTLLIWLDKVTEGFANSNPVFLQNYFKGATDNLISMLDALSGVVSSITKAGADPAVGEFWRIMGSGASAFDMIVREAVKVGPHLATLIKHITEIVAVFADAGQANAFLDVLSFIAGAVANVLKQMKPLLDILGPFIGAFSAIALVGSLASTTFLVIVGYLGAFAKAVSTLIALVPTLAVSVSTAGVSMSLAGTAVSIAWAPLTLIILGVAAAVAAVVVVAGIAQANMDKATKSIDDGFKKGYSSVTIFNSALLALSDGPAKTNLTNLAATQGGLNTALEQSAQTADRASASFQSYSVAADGFGYSSTQAGIAAQGAATATEEAATRVSTAGLNTAMDAIGQSLADLAVKELPDAQKAFVDFTDGQNLSKEAQLQALQMMPEYKKQLEEQAALYGINLEGLTENEKAEKLLTLARGEGEYAQIKANEAIQTSIDKLAEASQGAVDLSKAFTDSMTEAGFSIDTYIGKLEKQWLARQEVAINRSLLLSKGMSQDAIDILIAQGDQGFATMSELAKGSADQVKKASDNLVLTSGEAGTAVTSVSSQALDAIGNTYGKGTMGKVAQAMKDTGKSVDQVMQDMGIKIDKFKPTVKVETESGKKAVEDLTNKINAVSGKNVQVDVGVSAGGIQKLRELGIIRKDGGIIPKLPRFADGGGVWSKLGKVRGPGTGRSDSVPALLSAGEFVMNANATARFLPLLNAINDGRVAASQLQNSMAQSATVNSNASAEAPPIINITVNPSAGMDESELASAISREITFQMRKGAVA